MDASLRARAEQLASEFSSQATTAEELNSFLRLMMKSALERMLNTELDVHLGRKGTASAAAAEQQPGQTPTAASPSVPPAAAGQRSPNRRNGHSRKTVAITDEYTRECLALEVDRSLTADRVLDLLTHLFLTRGVPRHIRSDNGPEFIATAIRRHAELAGVEMLYIQPGSP